MKLSRKRFKDKSWITTGLKQSIKQKHLLYQKYIYDSTEVNNQIYKIFKNKLRTFIRKAEADYDKESFNYKTQSMKQMWRELGKTFRGGGRFKSLKADCTDFNSETI